MPTNRYPRYASSVESPASRHHVVTPSDTVDLPFLPRALYVTADGDLAMLMDGEAAAVVYPVTAGSILPMRPTRVNATGTTASVIAWD